MTQQIDDAGQIPLAVVVEGPGAALELSVVNPSGIFVPIFGPDYSPSIDLVKRLLTGAPGCPQIYFGVVDVRDSRGLASAGDDHSRRKGRALHRGVGRGDANA
jgi:hypothetical protein